MDISTLKNQINTEAGKQLKSLLLSQRESLNKIPEKITPFNFIGSLIEVLACKKAITKIDNILNIIGVDGSRKEKDPRDFYD